jgi:polyketide biosynthesis enoyl-CoA hydratase PksI
MKSVLTPILTMLNETVAAIELPSHLGPEIIEPFERLRDELSRDGKVKAVVLRGNERSFNAGASREALLDNKREIQHYVASIPRAVLDLPVPTIAAMAGHAVGGGLVLGLWCDHVFMAEESLYGANFMALGFTPGMGSTVVVEQAFGPYLGRELLYTGRMMTGAELRARGANRVSIMPRAGVEGAAIALAEEISENPARSLRLLSRTLRESRRAELERAIVQEFAMHQAVFADPGTRARIARQY